MNEPDPSGRASRHDLAMVLGISLAARLAFLLVMPSAAHSVDADHWLDVFQLLDRGVNPYEATTYLNWPPVWMGLIYLVGKTSLLLGIPFLRVLQAVLVGTELVVITATMHLVRALVPDADAGRIVVWGIALNPVAILLTCQHANFDVLVALWVVLFATSLVRFHRSGAPHAWLRACLFLGLGIVTKTVPFVLAPLLAYQWKAVPPRKRWLGAALVVGPVLAGVGVIYALAPQGVTENVLRYRSFGGWFGISGLLRLAGLSSLSGVHGMLFNLLLLIGMGATALTLGRGRDMAARDLVLLAALFLVMIPAFGPGYGPQYVQWSLPLLVALYAAYDRTWRRVVTGCAVVAVLTYLVEYALFPSHGWFLVHLTHGNEAVLGWSRTLSTQTGQTLVRLPWFASLLVLLGTGVERVVGRSTPEGA